MRQHMQNRGMKSRTGLLSFCVAWLKIVLLVIAVCGAGHTSLAATLTAAQTSYALQGPDIAILRDAKGVLSIDEVASTALADKFQSDPRVPALGYTSDVIWLRLKFARERDAPADWWLEFTNAFVNDVRLYSPRQAGYEVSQAGDHFPFAKREIAFHNPVFSLHITDSKTQYFFLRIASDSSLSFRLQVWQPSAFAEAGQLELLMLGLAMGMVVLSLLLTLINWFVARESLLGIFALFTVVILLYIPAQLGLLAQFVSPKQPQVGNTLVPWTQAMLIAMIFFLILRLLAPQDSHPRMTRFLKFGAWACLLVPLTREWNLYESIGGPSLQLFTLLGIGMTGWISWKKWCARQPGSGLLLAGHLVMIAPMVVHRGLFLGWFPVNTVTQYSWIPTLLVFLFFAQAGVIVDVRRLWVEYAKTRSELGLAREVAQTEQNLREEQSLFFAFVAHELRSPLSIIVMGLNNLSRELVDASSTSMERLQRISRAADRLGSLLERHLTLQRLKSAKFSMHFAPTWPQKPLVDSIEEVRSAFPLRDIVLEYADGLPAYVAMDRELVSIALTNLMTNASKYSVQEQPVEVYVHSDTSLHYVVMDRGPGVSQIEQERIFNAYQRAVPATGSSGFGIGLSIAQRVAEVHRGTLRYSDRPGGGAIFTLSIPLHQPPSEEPA